MFSLVSFLFTLMLTFCNCVEVLNCSEINARGFPGKSKEFLEYDEKKLLCVRENIEYSSIVSNVLCSRLLQSNNLISAYRYSLRALEIVPDNAAATGCLARIYHKLGDFIRASYYAELVYSNSLKDKHFDHATELLFIQMRESLRHFVYPVSPPRFNCPLSNNIDVCHLINKFNGSLTVLDVYKAFQAEFPVSHRGSSVLAREEFLELVTSVLSSQTDMFLHPPEHTSIAPFVTSFRGEFLEETENEKVCVKWPLHRTIFIYSDLQVYSTFGETAVGLSDALNKLGVPNSVVSVPEAGDDSVVIKMVSGPAGKPEAKHYVVWNFEKAPTVAMPGAPFGFIKDQCDREEAAYIIFYIENAHSFWDSIPSNMMKWAFAPENITHKKHLPREPIFVPGFETDNVMRFTRTSLLFSSK